MCKGTNMVELGGIRGSGGGSLLMGLLTLPTTFKTIKQSFGHVKQISVIAIISNAHCIFLNIWHCNLTKFDST